MSITETDPCDDANECQRLESELLTLSQRTLLDNERAPRWELNPPQREEYATPHDYVLALGRYADAVKRSSHG